MVVVHMGRDGDEWTVHLVGDRISKRGDTESGINEQGAVTPSHKPNVTTDQRMRVGFGQPLNSVTEGFAIEPTSRDSQN